MYIIKYIKLNINVTFILRLIDGSIFKKYFKTAT